MENSEKNDSLLTSEFFKELADLMEKYKVKFVLENLSDNEYSHSELDFMVDHIFISSDFCTSRKKIIKFEDIRKLSENNPQY